MNNTIVRGLSAGLGLFVLGLGRNMLEPKTVKLKENSYIKFLDVEHRNYFFYDYLSYWKDCAVDTEPMRKTHKFYLRPIRLSHVKN